MQYVRELHVQEFPAILEHVIVHVIAMEFEIHGTDQLQPDS
jgi:hypothetical protein